MANRWEVNDNGVITVTTCSKCPLRDRVQDFCGVSKTAINAARYFKNDIPEECPLKKRMSIQVVVGDRT
jgi:hypothetical protein